MHKKFIPLYYIVIFILISAACNLPFGRGSDPGAAQEEGGGQAQELPDLVPFEETLGGEAEAPEVQVTTSLMQNFKQRVERGDWSVEEGLVTSLKFLTGESGVTEINPAGQEISSYDGSGLLRAAAVYVESGDDAATREELERLLNLMFPPAEALERFSVPAEQSASGSRLARMLLQDDVSCTTIWRDGFPTDVTATCFEYRQVTVGGKLYRLFIPTDLRGEAGIAEMSDAIMDAVPVAVNAFLPYGGMPNTDIVITLLADSRDTEGDWTDAATIQRSGANCRMGLYPAMRDDSRERIQQVIAHELFHCFQFENYYAQTTVSVGINDWWVEGTAEYFGNVAFPTYNFENEYVRAFNINSASKTIFQMDYDNFVFFQYLANQGGNAAVIDLIASMPGGGGMVQQQEALKAYPGINDLFHQYARAVLEMNIADTGGGNIPLSRYVPKVVRLSETNDYVIGVRDFLIERRGLIFPAELYHELQENFDSTLTPITKVAGESTWIPLPGTMQGCSERRILWMATSTRGDDNRQDYTISAQVEERPCDRCLVGSWRLNNDSLWTNFATLISAANPTLAPTLASFDGEAVVTFTREGRGTVSYNGFIINYTQEIALGSEAAMIADNNLTISGDSMFSWYSLENTTLIVPEVFSQPTYDFNAYLTGPDGSREMPFANMVPIILPGGGDYTCTPSTLLIDTGTFPGPIQYDKIAP